MGHGKPSAGRKLTSYLIGAALFMPLTGILLRKFGHRRLLVVSIIGFTVFSVLCGCSRTLFEISLLRFFQGIFGANLVSLAQYIMKIHFKERLYELALGGFSLILAVAPIIGDWFSGGNAENAFTNAKQLAKLI